MITNVGKRIIISKLTNLTGPCFEYLAIGTAAPVNSSSYSFNYKDMNDMQFEVDRFRVSSVVPVGEDAVQIVAEVPRKIDAAITEIGLFTHSANTFGGSPSRLISGFLPEETWYAGPVASPSLVETLNVAFPPTAPSTVLVSKASVLSANSIYWDQAPRAGYYGLFINNAVSSTIKAYRNLPPMNVIAEPNDRIRLALAIDANAAFTLNAQLSVGDQTITQSVPIGTATVVTYSPGSEREYSVPVVIQERAVLRADAFDRYWQAVDTEVIGGTTYFNTTYEGLSNGMAVTINPYLDAPSLPAVKYYTLDFPITSQIDFNAGQQISLQFNNLPATASIMLDGLRYINTRNVNPYYGMVVYNVARNANHTPLYIDQSGTNLLGLEIQL